MGRSRSRRGRGKSGGQGSGGSGKGKGKGGSRGRSSGTRGGQGKGGSGKGKGTGGSKGRSNNTRGGQSKANRNQNKKARRTVSSVKKAVSKVAKNVGKAFKGRGASAATNQAKPKSKLKQQLSNLKKNIAEQSTKEARFKRRDDRLRNQFGLDYSRMNPSFKIDASIDQAAQKLGIRNHPLYQKYVPKDVKNWKFKYQMRAPTKLGISDGYRAPNRGGQTIATNTRNQLASLKGMGLRADPSQDIGRMYENLLGRTADQEGLDYWTNEFTSGKSDMEGIRRHILASDEFQGRSDADKSLALRGLRQKRARGLPDESVLKEIMMKRKAEGKPAPDVDKYGGTEGWLDFYKPENQKKLNKGLPPNVDPLEGYLDFYSPENQKKLKDGTYGKEGLPPDFTPMPSADPPKGMGTPDISLGDHMRGAMEPRKQEDWLGNFYRDFNIGGAGGKLDDEARNYWSGEAKKHGRSKVLDTIRGTAKKQGTWGGRDYKREKEKRRVGRTPRRKPPKTTMGPGIGQKRKRSPQQGKRVRLKPLALKGG